MSFGNQAGAPAASHGVLAPTAVEQIDRYWRAANYLTVGQIFLQANPLLREPLRAEHVKPRLMGHWGTSPGLNFIYVHLNRLIRERDANVVYIAGPGHGGPALLANVFLEGTYSEVYPEVSFDEAGMLQLFRQFSTPGGVPSHVSVPTPGSIHEGGELGYSLMHAFGAAFDNPDLLVACVVGDGEAETGPLEGSWKGVRFLNPARDGAVLPILHLNGYKISGPTVLGRTTDGDVGGLLRAHGYEPLFVEGIDPYETHQAFARTLDEAHDRIRSIQDEARTRGIVARPRWPAIVLRTLKGWTGPKVVDGQQVEGTFRAHQVPLPRARTDPEQLAMLESWLRSYAPETHFDADGTLVADLRALAPAGARRMGANPHANGGRLRVPLDLPDFSEYAVEVTDPGTERHESTRRLGQFLRDIYVRNPENYRVFCPDESRSNRLDAIFEVEARCTLDPIEASDDRESPDGRVMEVLSEHNCEGWLEGYLLTGRHGVFATYEAFAMVSVSMAIQHTKWLEASRALAWREPVSSLNVLLTSTCWRNDHNGFSHQGPGFIDSMLSMRGTVARVYLPPDANCLLSVADHCLKSRDYVNCIVIDKQPQLQWLDIEAAKEHCARGASRWAWASNDAEDGTDPDIVLACAGDVPTMETIAASWLIRRYAPELEVRVVNVVDLTSLFPRDVHPHGLDSSAFVELFTADTDVVLAFHGYAREMHQILHGRPSPSRFHIHGYQEQGTTTTPFDMVVLNKMSRYHLAADAIHRSRTMAAGVPDLLEHCRAMLERHHHYIRAHFDDMPEVRDWSWTEV
jgi:xylulose-5-phosphate/fructose-6-phosphate phosphoketolase